MSMKPIEPTALGNWYNTDHNQSATISSAQSHFVASNMIKFLNN